VRAVWAWRARARPLLPVIRPLLDSGQIKGMAHITGGGITDNLPRILPEGTSAAVRRASWEGPPLFRWLVQGGRPQGAPSPTPNLGLGLLIARGSRDVDAVRAALAAHGEPGSTIIGEIT